MSDTDGVWTWLCMGEKRMIRIGTGKTLRRLDEMLTDAMNGTFEESRYDESELSRLESRWKQYFTTSKMSMEQTKKERESMKKQRKSFWITVRNWMILQTIFMKKKQSPVTSLWQS